MSEFVHTFCISLVFLLLLLLLLLCCMYGSICSMHARMRLFEPAQAPEGPSPAVLGAVSDSCTVML